MATSLTRPFDFSRWVIPSHRPTNKFWQSKGITVYAANLKESTCAICKPLLAARRPDPAAFYRDDEKLWNPYLAAWCAITKHANLTNHDAGWYARIRAVETRARDALVRAFSWAIPWSHAIEVIVRHGPIVEVGAGTGYWALLVRLAGGEIVAYDQHGECDGSNGNPNNHFHRSAPHWINVLNHTADTFHESVDCDQRALFLCWPPLGSGMARTAVDRYRKAGGKKLIYVGKHDGGCTDSFDEEYWTEIERHAIPQWYGIHDELSVWVRK